MYRNLLVATLTTLILASCQPKPENLKVFSLFSDNMVLQQEQNVPVWGTSNPGATIKVNFREQSVSTKSDKQGKWKVELLPLKTGDSDSLIVTSGTDRIVLNNVLVGEVWLCSGQSNMEMNVGCTWAKVNDAEKEIADANYPDIRLFIVERNTSVGPIDTINTSGWKICSPETVGPFSAVGYFFGREIHTTQKIPVGLIQSAWGGTVAEAWTSAESLKLMNDFVKPVEKLSTLPGNFDSLKTQYEADYQEWLMETARADEGIKDNDTLFTHLTFDDSDWLPIQVPGMWEGTKIGALDGVVWFRKKINIPANQLAKDLTLTIAPPDDADETWFNGTKVGASDEWDKVRHYKVPAELVKEGENVVTVRLSDFQGDGGFMGESSDFSIYADDGWKLTFGGVWLCKIGYNIKDISSQPMKTDDPNRPTVLHNAMINPIATFAIKGAIWYQGESNSGRAHQYRELFPLMIKDWRIKWKQGNFPFLFVQLANFRQRNSEPVEDSWAELREAQLMALELPNTGMAVTIDIGDANDIHPSNKQDVGKRLAIAARNNVYGENIPFSGPIYSNMTIKEQQIELSFDFIYDGLKAVGSDKLKGFAIAGEDKKFYWAQAIIKNNKVIVNSEEVNKPVAVRYAWSSNPDCNLSNSSGIPASPFRTDNWKGLTAPN